jgi:hypothetical protein
VRESVLSESSRPASIQNASRQLRRRLPENKIEDDFLEIQRSWGRVKAIDTQHGDRVDDGPSTRHDHIVQHSTPVWRDVDETISVDEHARIPILPSSPDIPLAALAGKSHSTIHSDSVVPDSELAATQRDDVGLDPCDEIGVVEDRSMVNRQPSPARNVARSKPIPQPIARVLADDDVDQGISGQADHDAVPTAPTSATTRNLSRASKTDNSSARKRKAPEDVEKGTRRKSRRSSNSRKEIVPNNTPRPSVSPRRRVASSPPQSRSEARRDDADSGTDASESLIRVLAYWRDDHCLYPGSVRSISASGDFEVIFDDTFTKRLSSRDLRVCQFRQGDIVIYTGTESQSKQLEGQQRVVRVERAVTGEDAAGPHFRHDVVVTLPVDLDTAQEEGVTEGRILVEAVKVPAKPKRFLSRFDDRKLTAERISAMKDFLSKREDTVDRRQKSRRATSPPEARFRTAEPSVSHGPMFRGMTFILTHRDISTEEIDVAARFHNTSKESILRILKDNGGHVVDDFESLVSAPSSIHSPASGDNLVFHEPRIRDSTILLIADRPIRTPKYFCSLALGLPCVSTRWVELCEREKSLFDWKPFMMPAGFSEDMGTYAVGFQGGLAAEVAFNMESVKRRHARMRVLEGKSCVCVTGKGTGSKDVRFCLT